MDNSARKMEQRTLNGMLLLENKPLDSNSSSYTLFREDDTLRVRRCHFDWVHKCHQKRLANKRKLDTDVHFDSILEHPSMPPSVLRLIEQMAHDPRRGYVEGTEIEIYRCVHACPRGSNGFGSMSLIVTVSGRTLTPDDVDYLWGSVRRALRDTPYGIAIRHKFKQRGIFPPNAGFCLHVKQIAYRRTSTDRCKLTPEEATQILHQAINEFAACTDRMVVHHVSDICKDPLFDDAKSTLAYIKPGEPGFLQKCVKKSLRSE